MTKTFGFDFEITSTKICMNDGLAAVLSITSLDTSVSYKWQEYNYQTDTWVTFDSNRTTVTTNHTGQYRATCWKDGSFKKSNQIVLCTCLTLATSPYQIIGGCLRDSRVVLQFAALPGNFRVILQSRSDTLTPWRDIQNVTGEVRYISPQKISKTTLYRLEVTDADGVKHYSEVVAIPVYAEKAFDFQKPYTVIVTGMSGKKVERLGIPARDRDDAYKKNARILFPELFPVVVCKQGETSIILRRSVEL